MRVSRVRWSVAMGLATLLVALTVGACGGGVEIPAGQTDSGSTIAAAAGDVLVLSLPENPTTGYSWKMTLSSGLKAESDRYIEADKAGDLVGGGGTHVWRIAVVEAGTQIVKGEYRQQWDPTQTPQYFSLTVEVK